MADTSQNENPLHELASADTSTVQMTDEDRAVAMAQLYAGMGGGSVGTDLARLSQLGVP